MPAHSGVSCVGVAVQRQPDALQPDDQHELQAAARHRGEQVHGLTGREGADPEQPQVDHRVGDAVLDEAERDEQHDAADQSGEHGRATSSPWCARRRAAARR